jgi:hypothetical protein
LYLLWTKNPMHAPAIDAPKIPRSEGTVQVNGALLFFFLQTSLYLIGNWKPLHNQGNTDMALQSHQASICLCCWYTQCTHIDHEW